MIRNIAICYLHCFSFNFNEVMWPVTGNMVDDAKWWRQWKLCMIPSALSDEQHCSGRREEAGHAPSQSRSSHHGKLAVYLRSIFRIACTTYDCVLVFSLLCLYPTSSWWCNR
jgi:hypothetical protein